MRRCQRLRWRGSGYMVLTPWQQLAVESGVWSYTHWIGRPLLALSLPGRLSGVTAQFVLVSPPFVTVFHLCTHMECFITIASSAWHACKHHEGCPSQNNGHMWSAKNSVFHKTCTMLSLATYATYTTDNL